MNARFNPADYDTVDSRLGKFWTDHTNGRVLTELVHRDDKQYIVRADVYTDRDDPRPAATGYAEEVVGSSPVNKTSALENCETSAIGRALANLNYATKARASQTEMEKAGRRTPQNPAEIARDRLRGVCEENHWDLKRVSAIFTSQHGGTVREATDGDLINKFTQSLFGMSDEDLKVSA